MNIVHIHHHTGGRYMAQFPQYLEPLIAREYFVIAPGKGFLESYRSRRFLLKIALAQKEQSGATCVRALSLGLFSLGQ